MTNRPLRRQSANHYKDAKPLEMPERLRLPAELDERFAQIREKRRLVAEVRHALAPTQGRM